MNRIFATLVLIVSGVTVQAAQLADLTGGQTGRIEFQSTNPEHRHAMVNGRLGQPITVFGDLLMPTVAVEGNVPAVVFAHGSEGPAARYYDFWAKELNRNGYAVFIVDSFTKKIGILVHINYLAA